MALMKPMPKPGAKPSKKPPAKKMPATGKPSGSFSGRPMPPLAAAKPASGAGKKRSIPKPRPRY